MRRLLPGSSRLHGPQLPIRRALTLQAAIEAGKHGGLALDEVHNRLRPLPSMTAKSLGSVPWQICQGARMILRKRFRTVLATG